MDREEWEVIEGIEIDNVFSMVVQARFEVQVVAFAVRVLQGYLRETHQVLVCVYSRLLLAGTYYHDRCFDLPSIDQSQPQMRK